VSIAKIDISSSQQGEEFLMEFKKIIKNRVEYRFDPLTGEQCRINPDRARRLKQAGDEVELNEIAARTKETCPFCPERVESKTPKFPGDLYKGERIKLGETTIFPNSNPFGEGHAIGIISQAHFLDLDEFTVKMLSDNLIASKKYILATYESNKEAIWPIYIWNYMPPSAGSIIHPHSQILVETEPTPIQTKLLRKSGEYFNHNGKVYWEELVEQEKGLTERFIYGGDRLSVIASFAPRGFNEIQFIFKNESSLAELEQRQIADFADCLVKALKGYKKLGIGSFNLVAFSGPIHKHLDYYKLNARLISRPYPGGVYTNDTGPLERLCDIWVIDTLPEIVAEKLRRSFQ
jgi:galactose-1-phosphate uridylyltransferase